MTTAADAWNLTQEAKGYYEGPYPKPFIAPNSGARKLPQKKRIITLRE